MISERRILIEGQAYPITISDERKALSDAAASGRAILGVWSREFETEACPAKYLVESFSQADDWLLERVIRRYMKLPWMIVQTPWLIIRELTPEDAATMKNWEDIENHQWAFGDREALQSYCENQYTFYEYGIWAVTLRDDKRLIGMAGLSNLEFPDGRMVQELGYHISSPFRKKGYAKEACRGVIDYGVRELQIPALYIRTDASNEASVHLAESLGFQITQIGNESERCLRLYERNFP